MGDSMLPGVTLNTDYGAQLTSAENAIKTGVETGQVQAARDAFAHMDINDPDSTTSALSALVRAGAVDQAKAVQNLQFQRFQQGGQMEGASALDDALAPTAPPAPAQAAEPTPAAPAGPPAPLPPAQQAHQQAIMGFAKDSVDNLAAIKDPQERAAAAQEVKTKAMNMGVPSQFVDSALGDLSDGHLAQMDAYYGQVMDHPEFGGSGDAGPVPLHTATQGAINHPDSLTNPAVLRAVERIASHGGDTAGIQTALTAAMGYQGPLGVGQGVVQNHERTVAPTYGIVEPAPGTKVFSGDTGATIVGGEANPALIQPQAVPKGTDLFGFNPNPGGQGGGDVAGAPAGGNGAASPPHPAYKPQVAVAPVLAAVEAHPGQYLSGILGSPVTTTSTVRSASHNADVGGAPGSEHIPGNGYAVDFQVPAGMTHDQVAQKVIASGIPFDQLIFEKNGSGHIGWGNGNQRGQVLDRSAQAAPAPSAASPAASAASPPPGGATLLHSGQYVSGLFHPEGAPAGSLATQNPDHSLNPYEGTTVGAAGQAALQGSAASNPQVQHTQGAITSYNSLRANAGQMDGPAAMAMLQAVSGVSGAPADVIKAMGLPQEWLGKVQGFGGQGPLTPEMRQQVMDAGYHALAASYSQAAAVNAQRAQIEQRSGLPAGSTQAPLPAMPHRYFISSATLPPAAQRVIGQVYDGPNGPHMWSAKGWQATSQ